MEAKQTRGAKLLDALRSDLREGRVRPGARIGVGEDEAARRGVSAPTLRRAVRTLIEEGWLEAMPRGARVPHRAVGRLKVAFVRAADAQGRVVYEAERMARFRRHLEIEALRMGWDMEVWGYAGGDSLIGPDGAPGAWSALSHGLQGMVVSLWDVVDDAWILGNASRLEIPVSIWDERPSGGVRPRPAHLKYVDTSYSPVAARSVVRHLLGAGRQRIAWISPFHGSLWSQSRLEGVRAAAGAHLVCEAVDDTFRTHADFGEVDVSRWLDVARLSAHAAPWCGRGVGEVVRQMEILLQRRKMVERLEPLLRQAFDSGADAWIAANDDLALLAWDWLAARGVEVPRRVALCGFDDLVFAQERGLTSVYFQEDAAAQACVRHIARLRRPGEPEPEIEQIDGIVVPRGSSAPRR